MVKYSLLTAMLLSAMQCVTSQDKQPLPEMLLSSKLSYPTEEDALPARTSIKEDGDTRIYLSKTTNIAENEPDLSQNDLRDLTPEKIQKQADKIPTEVRDSGDMEPRAAADLDIAIPYFYRTCPYKWYPMWQYRWYWTYEYTETDGTRVVERCFTPWLIWGTYCGYGFCSWGYWPYSWWDIRHRCFTEYSLIRIPVFCYVTIYKKGERPVSKWKKWSWRYVWRPSGCCCKRYWWYKIAANTSPANP